MLRRLCSLGLGEGWRLPRHCRDQASNSALEVAAIRCCRVLSVLAQRTCQSNYLLSEDGLIVIALATKRDPSKTAVNVTSAPSWISWLIGRRAGSTKTS
jgi:hypothetical protein